MNLNSGLTAVLILTRFYVLSHHVIVKPIHIPQARIVGGHQAKPHSHPYIVSLQLKFLWIHAHICGGSILNERWVLTAAHCVSNSFLIRWLNMDAVAGAHDVDYYGPKAQVTKIVRRIPHPDYNGGVGPNDVAVLKTENKFIFSDEIKPINLPISALKMTDPDLMLPGWGVLKTTLFIPDLPSNLHELKVTYVPYEKCRDSIDGLLEVNEDNPLDKEANVCTGPLGGGTAACNGDSGGPLVLRVPCPTEEETAQNTGDRDENDISKNLQEIELSEIRYKECYKQNGGKQNVISFIIGIVSWGISPCGEKGAPSVFTNVSHYADFIHKYVTVT